MNSIMVKTLLGVTLALNASNNVRRQQEKQTNSSGNDWDKLWDKLNKPFCENNKPPYPPPYDFCCDNKEMFSDDYQPLFLSKESYSNCQSEFNSLHKMDGEQKFSDLLWESYGNVSIPIKACNDQFGNTFKNANCDELDKIANLKNDADNYKSFEKSCIEVLGEIDSQYQVSFKHLMDFLTAQAEKEKKSKCSVKVNETASGSGKIDMSDTHSGNFFDNIDFVTIGVIVIAVIAAVIAVSGLAYCCFCCNNGTTNVTNGTNNDNPTGNNNVNPNGNNNVNPTGNGTNGTNNDNNNQISMEGDKDEKGENENGEKTCLTSLFGYSTSSGQVGQDDAKSEIKLEDTNDNNNVEEVANQIDIEGDNNNGTKNKAVQCDKPTDKGNNNVSGQVVTNEIIIGNNEKGENNIEDTNANGTKNKAVQCDKPTDKGNNENGEKTCLTSLFGYSTSSGQDDAKTKIKVEDDNKGNNNVSGQVVTNEIIIGNNEKGEKSDPNGNN